MVRVLAERADVVLEGMKHACMAGKLPPDRRSQHDSPLKHRRRRRYNWPITDIRKCESSADLLIPKARFQRVVRTISRESYEFITFESSALLALQEAAEAYLIELIKDGNLCSTHAQRVTLMARDIALTNRIREIA
jgi:histone H3